MQDEGHAPKFDEKRDRRDMRGAEREPETSSVFSEVSSCDRVDTIDEKRLLKKVCF